MAEESSEANLNAFNAVIKGNGCLQPDTAFVMINGRLDTLPLQGRSGGDTLRITDIRYDGTAMLTVSAKNKKTGVDPCL